MSIKLQSVHTALSWSQRLWPLLALLASLAMLGAAHAFEAKGYSPCALCLRQREVYWGAAAIAVAGLGLMRLWGNPLLHRTVCVFLGVAFLAGAAVAAYHAGIEYKWWEGPSSCSVGSTEMSVEKLEQFLKGKSHVVACDEAAWRDPVLTLSMAGWNLIISLGLAAWSFFAAARPVETSRD